MSFLKKLLLCALLFCSREALIAQDASVLIEFESKEKGILIPRMTSNQILGIAEPVDGLMAYDSDQHIFIISTAYHGRPSVLEL